MRKVSHLSASTQISLDDEYAGVQQANAFPELMGE